MNREHEALSLFLEFKAHTQTLLSDTERNLAATTPRLPIPHSTTTTIPTTTKPPPSLSNPPPPMDLLRPHLQPFTHSLPAPVRSFGLSLLGPTCYKTLILDLHLTPSPCFSLAVSKTLGLAIIAASSIVKVPQILKLLQSQSAAGVSFIAYLLEIFADAVGVAYNARSGNPFSTYGEGVMILAQNVVVALLVLRFSGKSGMAGAFVAGLVGVGWALRGVDMEMLAWLQVGAGMAGVASKVPQIWTVWRQGGTGQLSAFAVGGLHFCYSLHHICFCEVWRREIADDGVVGAKLPDRLPYAHLYDSTGGRRQSHPLKVRSPHSHLPSQPTITSPNPNNQTLHTDFPTKASSQASSSTPSSSPKSSTTGTPPQPPPMRPNSARNQKS